MECTQAAIMHACQKSSSISEVKKIAQTCGVSSQGISKYWPFSKFGEKKLTCARLMSKNTKDKLKTNMDKQTRDFLKTVGELTLVENTQYEGVIQNGIFALLYLLKRNQEECIVLTDFNQGLRHLLKHPYLTLDDLDWSAFSILWSFDDKIGKFTMKVPGKNKQRYRSNIKSCLFKKKGRFFLSLLTLETEKSYHANVLMYDKLTGLLERFDSYQVSNERFETKNLDKELRQMFVQIDPQNFSRMITPPNIATAVRKGLQTKAEQERWEMRPGDPIGFCLPWSLLYADTRLTLPNQNPDSIPELFEIMAAEYNLTLTKFIRNYAENFAQINHNVQLDFLNKYPEYQKYKDPDIVLYILFLKQLSRYGVFYT
jgi:hypothetical protein